MAWTMPATFVAEQELTAAMLNTYLRDNLLDTEAAKATEAGQLLVTSGVNSVAMRKPLVASANAQVLTSSTTPTTLGSGTPSLSVTHGGAMLILFAARMHVNAGPENDIYCAPEVVGAEVARVRYSLMYDQDTISRYAGHVLHYNMSPGTHTVRLMYWSSDAGTQASYSSRSLVVIPL